MNPSIYYVKAGKLGEGFFFAVQNGRLWILRGHSRGWVQIPPDVAVPGVGGQALPESERREILSLWPLPL